MSVHAKYCLDSDPFDHWFWDEIEFDELLSIHVDKFLHDELVLNFEEHLSISVEKDIGGYEFAISSGPINAPRYSVFNAPGRFEPTVFVELQDLLTIIKNTPTESITYRNLHGETWEPPVVLPKTP
jgi:hypothetical protein